MSESFARFLAERNPEHFNGFVHSTLERVFATARRVCRNYALAQDVTQDAYSRLLKKTSEQTEIRDPQAYLTALVTKIGRTRLRQEARRNAHERRRERARSSSASSLSPEELLDISDAIASLPKELSDVVCLRYYAGMKVQEIARELAIDPRTVHTRAERAVISLRSKLSSAQGLAVLPYLDLSVDAALPTVALPASLIAKLEGLIASTQPLSAVRRSLPSALIASGLALVCILGMMGIALHKFRGGSRVETFAMDAPVDVVPAVVDAAVPDEPRPQSATPGPEPGAVVATDARTEHRLVATDDPAAQLERSPLPASTRLVLHVVDEAGEPVRQGTVDFEAAPATELHRGQHRLARSLGLVSMISAQALAAVPPLAVEIPSMLHGLPLRIHVTAPGFVGHGATTFVARPGREETLTVTMLAAMAVTVHVRNARTSEPVEGATVEVDDDPVLVPVEFAALTGLLGTPRRPAGKTSAAGTVVLPEVRQRQLRLSISAPPLVQLTAVDVAAREEITLWLHDRHSAPATGSLVVRVRDLRGQPWPNCEFRLINDPAGEKARRTDAQGELRIDGVAVGKCFVELVHPRGGLTQEVLELKQALLMYSEAAVDIRAGEEAELVLEPNARSGSLQVLVVDEAGKPCPGVPLALTSIGSPKATTNRRGEAVFRDLEVETIGIELVAADARVTLGKAALVAGSEVRARVTLGGGSLTGQVLDEALQPVAARIHGVAPGAITATVAGDGRFVIDGLVPGSYELLIAPADEWLVPQQQRVVLPARGVSKDLDLRLQRGGRVTVLVATPGGGPATVRSVECQLADGTLKPLHEVYRGRREAEFTPGHTLNPGEYTLVVEGPPGTRQEVVAQVRPGQVTEVRVTVELEEAAAAAATDAK